MDEAAEPAMMAIEVCSADAGGVRRAQVQLPLGATLADALLACGIDPPTHAAGGVGVFGRLCALDARLTDGDRVELYRPLLIDPKLARRRRAGAK